MVHLAHRLPTGDEEMPRLVQDPTVASLLCTIYQLANKNDKNSKLVLAVNFLIRVFFIPVILSVTNFFFNHSSNDISVPIIFLSSYDYVLLDTDFCVKLKGFTRW